MIFNYILKKKKRRSYKKIFQTSFWNSHIYIYGAKIPSAIYSTILPTTLLPGIVGDSHSKFPPHTNNIFSTSWNVPPIQPLLLYPLFTPPTFHRFPPAPLISPSRFLAHQWHPREYTTLCIIYVANGWRQSRHPFRLISRPWYFSRFHPFSPSSFILIETKRKEERSHPPKSKLSRGGRNRWKFRSRKDGIKFFSGVNYWREGFDVGSG